jgi:hypothetical protein
MRVRALFDASLPLARRGTALDASGKSLTLHWLLLRRLLHPMPFANALKAP